MRCQCTSCMCPLPVAEGGIVVCAAFCLAAQDAGVLPSALLNFVALLGWAPQSKQEIFSLQELVEDFSLDQITRVSGIHIPPSQAP